MVLERSISLQADVYDGQRDGYGKRNSLALVEYEASLTAPSE
jgi:hypothetical protein